MNVLYCMYCTLYCTDLVLPLCRHDLGVGARHLDAGVEAALDMRSLDVPAVDPGSPHPTVVGTLRPGEPILGPTKRVLVTVKQRVLLLDTKPRLLMLRLLHDLQAFLPVVGRHCLLLVVVGLTQDQDVVPPGEGAGVDLDRSQVDVRVGSVRLVAGTAVIVPLWEILHL